MSDGTTEKTNRIHNKTAYIGLNVNWTVFDGLGIQATYENLKELQNLGCLLYTSNIAPLNFKIQDEGDEWMIQIQGKGNPITITAHDAVETVSYTHLDVYKRQALCRLHQSLWHRTVEWLGRYSCR